MVGPCSVLSTVGRGGKSRVRMSSPCGHWTVWEETFSGLVAVGAVDARSAVVVLEAFATPMLADRPTYENRNSADPFARELREFAD